jgi:hypothetical protein
LVVVVEQEHILHTVLVQVQTMLLAVQEVQALSLFAFLCRVLMDRIKRPTVSALPVVWGPIGQALARHRLLFVLAAVQERI